ncbi:hypothetical protein SUDANB70_02159 [Streptomyces sp. enrichment culture]
MLDFALANIPATTPPGATGAGAPRGRPRALHERIEAERAFVTHGGRHLVETRRRAPGR